MKIILGSTSEQKGKILKSVIPDAYIILIAAESEITDQPLDEETTIHGSINRAQNAIHTHGPNDFEFSVGLEGGLSYVNNLYYLVCVASIIDKKGRIFVGISKKIPLPRTVSIDIEKGKQFGESIRLYKNSSEGKKSPEVFALIEELISRKDSFTEAISLAYFQLKYIKDVFK